MVTTNMIIENWTMRQELNRYGDQLFVLINILRMSY